MFRRKLHINRHVGNLIFAEERLDKEFKGPILIQEQGGLLNWGGGISGKGIS